MEPPRTQPEDWQAVLQAFKSGGWLTGFVGAGGMIARLLLRPEEGMTWIRAISHTLAAFLMAMMTWYAIRDVEMAGQLKAGCYGIAGMASPELLDFALRWINAQADRKIGEVKKGSHGTRKKKRK